MSWRTACFVASSFDLSDWLKLLGLVGAMIALYLVAKKLSGGEEECPSQVETPTSTQPSATQADLDAPSESCTVGEQDGSDQPEKTDEEEVRPKNIVIRDWNFAKFEIQTGPPDLDNFADELLVDLFDRSTGQSWRQTYFVATPAGLETVLDKRHSNFMFLPQTLVMNRYDLNELRQAVLGDLGALEEQRGEVPDDARDSTTAGNDETVH
jgi:hypothetical protein